jgi:hypothetical protein
VTKETLQKKGEQQDKEKSKEYEEKKWVIVEDESKRKWDKR